MLGLNAMVDWDDGNACRLAGAFPSFFLAPVIGPDDRDDIFHRRF